MSKLISHLENYLGSIRHGWNQIPLLHETGVQVVQFDSNENGCELVLSTLGLSKYPLRSASSGETIYHELLFFAKHPVEPNNLPSVLGQAASAALGTKRALLRGDVLGPGGKVLKDSKMEAFFATLPILLPPEFAATEDDEGHGLALVWLLPITSAEAAWVKSHGWEAFEEELDQQVPDTLNWYREEMVLR